MPICAPLVRRELLNAAGPWDESLRVVEDWEYWIRCAHSGAAFQFDPSPEGECFIRLHPGSASQDRPFMTGGVLAMRIRVLGYLSPPYARRLMFAVINDDLAARDVRARREAYKALGQVAVNVEERMAIVVARAAGPGTSLHEPLRPLLKRLPWRLRTLALG